jgi:hypothetical protein
VPSCGDENSKRHLPAGGSLTAMDAAGAGSDTSVASADLIDLGTAELVTTTLGSGPDRLQ